MLETVRAPGAPATFALYSTRIKSQASLPTPVPGFADASLSMDEEARALLRARKLFSKGSLFDVFMYLATADAYERDMCTTMADLHMPFDCHDWTTFLHWSRDFRNHALASRSASRFLKLAEHIRARAVAMTTALAGAIAEGEREARAVLAPPLPYEPAFAGGGRRMRLKPTVHHLETRTGSEIGGRRRWHRALPE